MAIARLLPCLLFLLSAPAFAWSELGHRLVGDLAAQRLTPKARAEVKSLLAGEDKPSLGGIASWADALRNSDPERFRATTPWHYLNAAGGGCAFLLERDCPGGSCVVGAIEAQRAVLADHGQTSLARREALKFLVHFVGDVHQPLHAGSREDAGGNRFQISLRTDIEPEAYARRSYVNGVMGTNLHSIWDYYILADARLTPAKYRDRLLASLPRSARAPIGTPLEWARESCAISQRDDFYPQVHTMTRDYLAKMRPMAEQRVVLAASRLAALLNETLKGP
jgi:nuclease S1